MTADLLTAEVFGYLLILVRVAAMLALMPAIGESNIPPQMRLALAVMVTLVIYPLVRSYLPAMPANGLAFGWAVISEVLIGLFIGLTARLMMSALHVAGTVVAFQSGLAAAQSFDPSQGGQSAILARLLTVMGVVAIFTAELHHVAIRGMAGSYIVFPPGGDIVLEDAMRVITDIVASSFALGLQIAAPFLVYGLVFNIALGLIARLMPQFQVFFVAMPANIMFAFVILMFIMSSMMLWFLSRFEMQLSLYLGG